MSFTESSYENAIIQLFTEELSYDYCPGPEITRDYRAVVLEDVLEDQLRRINPDVHPLALEEAMRQVLAHDHPSLIENNKTFHTQLIDGIRVNYYHEGQQSALVRLVDFDHVANNTFQIVNQFTVNDAEQRRPDIVIFVNGLPLVVMELKSESREDTDTSEAYTQIRNYLQAIPSLFTYNSFCIISDMVDTRAGTITAGLDRFMHWKSVDGTHEDTRAVSFDTLFRGMFDKRRLLDIIQSFVLFLGVEGEKPIKILGAYHQYYAVNKAVQSTLSAVKREGKAGVFWHTQGSGKSLSMVFFSALLSKPLHNPTLVVLTDRNDLDEQLYNTFCTASDHLRQTPIRAESRAHLRELLDSRQAGGIIFTTMQKFEEGTDTLCDRRNVILMADEAHRSQYGLEAKVDKKGRLTYGMAKYVRDALPNATFIGFTGTPIESLDRSTPEVFGDYIDIYDMTQAVEDGATRPIFYESRVMRLDLRRDVLQEIDRTYDDLATQSEPHHIARSKKELGRMESILGADETIDTLCRDIIGHYQDRAHILAGKAMVVAYSRPIAMKLYHRFLELKPQWQDKLIIVMTRSNKDPEEWFDLIGDQRHRKDLAKQFRDPDSPIKIAIVVDMWLTGFDVPSLNTMYLYKPMKGHTLMQAIARVNRVYKDKEGGLIVDYVGIASALKKAMKDYTQRDMTNFGNNDIGEAALPKFMEKLEICRDLMHGLDYSLFMSGTDKDRAELIVHGMTHIMGDEEGKKHYLREATALRQAETLCRSLLDEASKIETAFFDAVRAGVVKISGKGKLSVREINDRINELLKASIKSQGVINVFEKLPEFSIFDPEYLRMISEMKQKNLAVEMLRRLLGDEIKVYMRSNAVKAEKFSKLMQELINRYRNGMITNAEVIDELLKMADEMKKARDAGEDLGLTEEELAFYDAITKPENIKDFFSNDELISMTRELTELLRKSRTIDWQLKEQARARMRSMVKRLLKRHKYPPEGQQDALDMVIRQAELMSEQI